MLRIADHCGEALVNFSQNRSAHQVVDFCQYATQAAATLELSDRHYRLRYPGWPYFLIVLISRPVRCRIISAAQVLASWSKE